MKTFFTASSLAAFVVFLAILSDGRLRGVDARGPFRCPRMIDCTQVCQGFDNCCVNGRCICEKCSLQRETADTPSTDHRYN